MFRHTLGSKAHVVGWFRSDVSLDAESKLLNLTNSALPQTSPAAQLGF